MVYIHTHTHFRYKQICILSMYYKIFLQKLKYFECGYIYAQKDGSDIQIYLAGVEIFKPTILSLGEHISL